MTVLENHCVDCGLPCLGSSCKYRDVPVPYCDYCHDTEAIYIIDGDDCCEDCAKKIMESEFRSYSLLEQAQILNIAAEEYI